MAHVGTTFEPCPSGPPISHNAHTHMYPVCLRSFYICRRRDTAILTCQNFGCVIAAVIGQYIMWQGLMDRSIVLHVSQSATWPRPLFEIL